MRTISYPAGSGYGVWSSQTLNFIKDFKVTDKPTLTKVGSVTLGEDHDQRISDVMSTISAQPKIFNATLAAQLAAFWPYTDPTTQLGALIFGATDKPFVLNFRDGNILTKAASAITKLSPITFAADKPLAADIEWTNLLAGGSNVGDANSDETVSSGAYVEPVWDPADELAGDAYTMSFGFAGNSNGTFGNGSPNVTVSSTAGLVIGQALSGAGIPANTTILSITDSTHFVMSANSTQAGAATALTFTPLNILPDKDGITFTPTVKLEPVKPVNNATTNYRITGISAVIEFRPLNIDIPAFYNALFPMQGSAVKLGGSVRAAGAAVSVVGSAAGKAKLTIPLAGRAKDSALAVSNKEPRVDKVQLMALQTTAAGAWIPLYTLGTV